MAASVPDIIKQAQEREEERRREREKQNQELLRYLRERQAAQQPR